MAPAALSYRKTHRPRRLQIKCIRQDKACYFVQGARRNQIANFIARLVSTHLLMRCVAAAGFSTKSSGSNAPPKFCFTNEGMSRENGSPFAQRAGWRCLM